jgi:hypothetical protein
MSKTDIAIDGIVGMDDRPDEVAIEAVPEPLRTLIEMSSDGAADHFRRHGIAIPQWRALTAANDFIFVADPPSDDKDESSMLVRALFAIKEANAVVFTDEAWTLEIGDGKTRMTAQQARESEGIQHTGISNHPRRKEAIIFIAEDSDGHYYTGQREIMRPAKKGKAKLGPLRLFMPRRAEGRFASWLTPKGAS